VVYVFIPEVFPLALHQRTAHSPRGNT
jgi:hypothetical protein